MNYSFAFLKLRPVLDEQQAKYEKQLRVNKNL